MSNVNTKSDVNEVTNKTSNSLMNKTKAQLIEIILRKDEVERNLRKDIKDTCASVDKLHTERKFLEKKFEILKNDYREECDKNASDFQEFKNIINRYETIFSIFVTVIIFLVILSIIITLIY